MLPLAPVVGSGAMPVLISRGEAREGLVRVRVRVRVRVTV